MSSVPAWPKTISEIWLLVRVLALLTSVRLLLPRVRLDTLLGWLTPSRLPRVADLRAMERAARYTDALLRRLPHSPPGNCLPRSLTLYYFATRCGFPVRLHCGVRRVGEALQGHAWLSLHGQPFSEEGSPTNSYPASFSLSRPFDA